MDVRQCAYWSVLSGVIIISMADTSPDVVLVLVPIVAACLIHRVIVLFAGFCAANEGGGAPSVAPC